MPFIRRAQSKASAAPTRIFLGSHPRSEQVPPNGLESTIATFHPAARHRDATADAAEPVPMATKSNFFVMSFSQRPVQQPDCLYPSELQLFGEPVEEKSKRHCLSGHGLSGPSNWSTTGL